MGNCKELITHGRGATANHKQSTATQSFVGNGTATRGGQGCDGAAACGCHGARLRTLEEGEVASLAAEGATAFQRWGVARPPSRACLSPMWRSLVKTNDNARIREDAIAKRTVKGSAYFVERTTTDTGRGGADWRGWSGLRSRPTRVAVGIGVAIVASEGAAYSR